MNRVRLVLYICLLLYVQLTFAMDGKQRLCKLSGTNKKKALPSQYIQSSEILMLAIEDTQGQLRVPFSKEQFALAKKLLENE